MPLNLGITGTKVASVVCRWMLEGFSICLFSSFFFISFFFIQYSEFALKI